MRAYVEYGVGNSTVVSTEIECGLCEYRIPTAMHVGTLRSVYLRVWLGTHVLIIDSVDGIKLSVKPTRRIKVLVGFMYQEGR